MYTSSPIEPLQHQSLNIYACNVGQQNPDGGFNPSEKPACQLGIISPNRDENVQEILETTHQKFNTPQTNGKNLTLKWRFRRRALRCTMAGKVPRSVRASKIRGAIFTVKIVSNQPKQGT